MTPLRMAGLTYPCKSPGPYDDKFIAPSAVATQAHLLRSAEGSCEQKVLRSLDNRRSCRLGEHHNRSENKRNRPASQLVGDRVRHLTVRVDIPYSEIAVTIGGDLHSFFDIARRANNFAAQFRHQSRYKHFVLDDEDAGRLNRGHNTSRWKMVTSQILQIFVCGARGTA